MKENLVTAKPHYAVLDGLRGVAAIMVVAFHIFEAHAPNRFGQIINHGYLAVDFFFLLSGFVIGYAYDDRWGKITFKNFFKRRLIRLHPMVVMGMIVGAIGYYFQQSEIFPLIGTIPNWKVFLILIIGCTLLPVPPSMDIRGWSEMHPLDGPGWSLFYEYVANILYGTIVRRFSKIALSFLVFLSAAALIYLTVFGKNGDVIGGWALEPQQIQIGVTRVMYPFFAGLLLCRITTIIKVRNAFLWSSLLVILALSLPRMGDERHLWMNGLYESVCIIFIFPLIVYLGAGGEVKGKFASSICKFLGDISYPIYITHYTFIYIYTAWVYKNKPDLATALPFALLTFFSCIIVAYACLKLYDEPVRRWLSKKL
ncbi:MAG: acyltransferase [Bacteroidota bacterium]